MKNDEAYKRLLAYFQSEENESLQIDEAAVKSFYEDGAEKQSLAIKIFAVFGGLLASLAFTAFLLIGGLYNSGIGLILFGIIFIAVALWVNKVYDRILIDTVSISFFIVGFVLINFGCQQLNVDENLICLSFILIAIAALFLMQNYLMSFISVLIITGSLLTLISLNNAYDVIHLYVSLIAVLMTFCFLKEATLITRGKQLSKLYGPLRIALVFSFLAGLLPLAIKGIVPVSPQYLWLSSIVIIALIVYLISRLVNVLHITQKNYKVGIYIITILALLPTAFSPAIPGAVLIIVLSYMINYKTGAVIGVVSFLYFLVQFYYDLNYTLLTKSVLLFSTGILFIILYMCIHKKLAVNEKV